MPMRLYGSLPPHIIYSAIRRVTAYMAHKCVRGCMHCVAIMLLVFFLLFQLPLRTLTHTHVSVRTRTSIPRRRRPTPTNVLARFQGHIRVRACNNICSAYARTHAQRNAACDLRTRRMVYVCMCVCVFVCNTKRL